jgi:hypothetical protein
MQINIDFTRPLPNSDDKREALITFRTSHQLKADITAIAKRMNVDVSALINEYALKGYMESYKNEMLIQIHGDTPLKDHLRR